LPEFEPREALLKLTKADILALTQEGFSLLFRHSPIKRAKLLGLLRNARAL
jgi:epoxyqueuosine reductase QueG